MSYIKVAGVSVNTEFPPTRKELVASAMQSKEFYKNNDALEEINQQINKSGLYRNIPKNPSKIDKQK